VPRRLLATCVLGSAVAALAAACTSPGPPAAAPRRATAPVSGPVSDALAGRVAPSPADAPPLPFDRTAHSTTAPSSPWVVVNKTHPLPASYRPDLGIVRGYQVAPPVIEPLARLLEDAAADGVRLKIASAFRSHGYQRRVYEQQVARRGRAAADRISARPGHSEHQTGLAVDLVTPHDPGCSLRPCFAQRPGGRWIATHAWRYGFVVRYRPGTERETGYQAEPWHLRYVGAPLARELHETAVTLEEFFDVPGGDYDEPANERAAGVRG
jgi:D-alanyl-D-alanine carboxypeptidase